MQYGLDFGPLTDPITKKIVPWADCLDNTLIKKINQAPWKFVDTETTGLTPASERVTLSNKELMTMDNSLRMRIVSVVFPDLVEKRINCVAFDLDTIRHNKEARQSIAKATLSNHFYGHNAGFDLFWLRFELDPLDRHISPEVTHDTMLESRLFKYDLPLIVARWITDPNASAEQKDFATNLFIKKESGFSAEAVSFVLNQYKMDKTYQMPKNWVGTFLTQAHYNYATDDVWQIYYAILKMYGLSPSEVEKDPTVLIQRYAELKEGEMGKLLNLIEPQVPELVDVRLKGIPISIENADYFIESRTVLANELAEKIAQMEPSLSPYVHNMASLDMGVDSDLKDEIGKAFQSRGLDLLTTEKTNSFKIGEKDLRMIGAEVSESAKDLFNTWIKLNKAKKAANMAKELKEFYARSPVDRIMPLLSHGPVTGRLSSSEPNSQQFPRDQDFRAIVAANTNNLILASDYSALDMRVGSALAIRAQQQIKQCVVNQTAKSPELLKALNWVFSANTPEELEKLQPLALTSLETRKKDLKEWQEMLYGLNSKIRELKEKGDYHQANILFKEKGSYYKKRDHLKYSVLLWSFVKTLIKVRINALKSGEPEWGALRDVFRIGIDVHTATAINMQGLNAKEIFEGKEGEELEALMKKWKKDLGDKRQSGKVGNLSLLYAMQAQGLKDAASKNYNIHWTLEEATEIRDQWFMAYPEIELWHLWTELNPFEKVKIPDRDKGGDIVSKDAFISVTLGNRKIVAFGLNAALSYEDQSTGADILGTVMHELKTNYNDIFNMIINQVHDEIVFEIPEDRKEEITQLVGNIMDECANRFLMVYGVPSACSPAVGKIWLKD